MTDSQTSYKIVLRIRGNLDHNTTVLLSHLFSGRLTEETCLSQVVLPAHPFFTIPGWYALFSGAGKRTRPAGGKQYIISLEGATALLEQDIGLFLNWVQPYLSVPATFNRPTRQPLRLAVIRNSRHREDGLAYFLDHADKIAVDYVDRPANSYRYHLQGKVSLA